MSDARQAIRSAELAGAAESAPETLAHARWLLDSAQTQLESGAFSEARRSAVGAREQAILARERAAARSLQ